MTTQATLRARLKVILDELGEIVSDGYGVLPQDIADTLAKCEGDMETCHSELADE